MSLKVHPIWVTRTTPVYAPCPSLDDQRPLSAIGRSTMAAGAVTAFDGGRQSMPGNEGGRQERDTTVIPFGLCLCTARCHHLHGGSAPGLHSMLTPKDLLERDTRTAQGRSSFVQAYLSMPAKPHQDLREVPGAVFEFCSSGITPSTHA